MDEVEEEAEFIVRKAPFRVELVEVFKEGCVLLDGIGGLLGIPKNLSSKSNNIVDAAEGELVPRRNR